MVANTRLRSEVRSRFFGYKCSNIQGSGLGPVFYIFNAVDLPPVRSSNILFKYADDTYLIVPAADSDLISQELDNISDWAIANNLKLNKAKYCEMVVCLPNANRFHTPLPHPDLARSLYGLETLKAHGLLS